MYVGGVGNGERGSHRRLSIYYLNTSICHVNFQIAQYPHSLVIIILIVFGYKLITKLFKNIVVI